VVIVIALVRDVCAAFGAACIAWVAGAVLSAPWHGDARTVMWAAVTGFAALTIGWFWGHKHP
jgi:hypothetical protein